MRAKTRYKWVTVPYIECAVKNAAERELISRSRYESYLRILDTIPKPKY